MREGEIIEAKVTGVHEFGVELESGGKKGFVQPIELAWDSKSPREVEGVRVGESIAVLVYAVTPECFYASLKRAHPESDPWRDPATFETGSRHSAVVAAIFDWGYKLKIAEGVDGIIPCVTSTAGLRVGDRVDVEVASVDVPLRKIELRALLPLGRS